MYLLLVKTMVDGKALEKNGGHNPRSLFFEWHANACRLLAHSYHCCSADGSFSMDVHFSLETTLMAKALWGNSGLR
jgi:hypothetical protein